MTGVTYLKSEQCQKSWPKQDAEARKESPPESLENMGLLTLGLALSESGSGGHTLLFVWKQLIGSLLQQA